MHFTPTYASWLNQIEIWFGILARDVIRGGVWKSKQELVNQIIYYNEDELRPMGEWGIGELERSRKGETRSGNSFWRCCRMSS